MTGTDPKPPTSEAQIRADVIAAVVESWPTDSQYVADWHPADAELHRRDGWRSFSERSAAVLRQRQERVADAALGALLHFEASRRLQAVTADSVVPLNRIDEDELAELEALLAAATPAPWCVREGRRVYRDHWHIMPRVAEADASVDAALIAALRNAAPLLLGEVKAQREELAEAQQAEGDLRSALLRMLGRWKDEIDRYTDARASGLVFAVGDVNNVLDSLRPVAALGTADQPPKGASNDE